VAAQTVPEPDTVSPPAVAPHAASPQAQRQPPHQSQPQPEPEFQPPAPPAPKPAPVRVVTQRPSRLVACCWPLGEPGTKTFHFCDAEATPGKPYCQAHAQLAYVKVRDRREDAA
jgi:GcrA cell cycle regulator